MIIFSASFVAVPAFIRVDPVTISGPTINSIANLAACANSEPGEQAIPTVRAPNSRAFRIAPSTYGVLPLAAIPTSASSRKTSFQKIPSPRPPARPRFPPSPGVSAASPPAIMP